MTFNAAAVDTLFAAVVSGSMALGVFENTAQHEPKSAPQGGLHCAVWIDAIKPLPSSGLAQTTGLVSFFIRIYNSMLTEPQDDIDPAVVKAVAALMTAYTGNFDFGGTAGVRSIDLLGSYSTGLMAQAGYMEIDRKFFRVMVINLPVIINDMFLQAG